MGIESLNGKVIVFDEAHNLMEAIGQMNSLEISSDKFSLATTSLETYLLKYEKRMSPTNVKKIKELITILNSFTKFL